MTEQEVLAKSDISRRYKSFRNTDWYGGCATADCLGCNLDCAPCWSWKSNSNPAKYGEFYTPEEVVEELEKLDQPLWRISSGEPTLKKEHLLKVLELSSRPFLLETNGILLDEDYCEGLSRSNNLHVRLSLKGYDEDSFEKMTGKKGFSRQIEAVKNLQKYGISFHCTIIDLYDDNEIKIVREKLGRLIERTEPGSTGVKKSSTNYRGLEVERFKPYPHIIDRMEARGYDYR